MTTTYMKFVVIFTCFSLMAYGQNDLDRTEFLIGTWKMEGENTYEQWSKGSDVLVGESFKIKDGVKDVLETLRIEKIDNAIVYLATVMNQNNGKGVVFTLNPEIKNKLSFENTTHDFPKKIRYTKLTDSEIFVEVLGDNNEGFSYKMQKQ